MEGTYHRIESTDEEESVHGDGELLVHVADGNKARWHHINDLDSFFSRVYAYLQNDGYGSAILKEAFDLFQMVFVAGFATLLFRCVNYDVLFANNGLNATDKISFHDYVYSGPQCSARIRNDGTLVFFLILSSVFFVIQLLIFPRDVFRLSEMREFYSTTLHVKSNDLQNITWHEVQQRLKLVQTEQQMCVQKQELTELDIYNRILRFKNYMIAMVNKDVFHVRYNIPILNKEIVFFTKALKYNMEMILFLSHWSIFQSNYELKEEYKHRSNREELISNLKNVFLYVGIFNLVLSPFIFVWLLIYHFFQYAELLKRDPGALGTRVWSEYSKLYLRHFNELDHEFCARMNRAYKPASKYLLSFNNPILVIISRNVSFVAGAILGVIVFLAIWDEDVLRIDHILRAVTVLTIFVVIGRALTPKENEYSCPEHLMKKVLSQIHYAPTSWHGRAHTDQVRGEFSQLFQYRAVNIVEELLSPFLTPFVLMFPMRQRSDRIVDFFRNFTVDIAGVGDVCSFAQMDIRRHGDPRWQATDENRPPPQPFTKTEGGKTEMSLVHFAITNPQWKPTQPGGEFLNVLKSRAHHDALLLSRHDVVQNPLLSSLQSLGSIDMPQTSIFQQPVRSMMTSNVTTNTERRPQSIMRESMPGDSVTYDESMMMSSLPQMRQSAMDRSQMRLRLRGVSRKEGGVGESGLGLISTIAEGQQGFNAEQLHKSTRRREAMLASRIGESMLGTRNADLTPQAMAELAPVEMGISALYMHELYHNKLITEDRASNWEPVGENANSGSFHDDRASSSRDILYRASDRDSARRATMPNPRQPLLESSNSGNFNPNRGHTYLSFHEEDFRTANNQAQHRFSAESHFNNDLAVTHEDNRLQNPDLNAVHESLGTGPGIDAFPDPRLSTNLESSPVLEDLPSLGFPPSYDERGFDDDRYQPPPL